VLFRSQRQLYSNTFVDATKSHIAADSDEVKDTVGLIMKQNIMHFNNVILLKCGNLIAGKEHDTKNTPRSVTKIVRNKKKRSQILIGWQDRMRNNQSRYLDQKIKQEC
jgi:hypothetical protein